MKKTTATTHVIAAPYFALCSDRDVQVAEPPTSFDIASVDCPRCRALLEAPHPLGKAVSEARCDLLRAMRDSTQSAETVRGCERAHQEAIRAALGAVLQTGIEGAEFEVVSSRERVTSSGFVVLQGGRAIVTMLWPSSIRCLGVEDLRPLNDAAEALLVRAKRFEAQKGSSR